MTKQRPVRPVQHDYLSVSKNGKTYELGEAWSLSDSGSYSMRLKVDDRAFAHGGYAVGDGKVKGRTIQVEFNMRGASEIDHDNAVNAAYRYFSQRDYTLRAGRQDRAYHVAGLSKIKHKFQKGFKQRWSNVTVSLLLADPFRYAVAQTVIRKSYAVDQEKGLIIFENLSSIDAPLIWTFAPPEGGTAADIKVIHAESGESFTLKDTLLTAPAVAVVNAEAGTVRRDTGNSLNTFNGIFLHALPGLNTYQYTGAACNVSIAFTPRWFV